MRIKRVECDQLQDSRAKILNLKKALILLLVIMKVVRVHWLILSISCCLRM